MTIPRVPAAGVSGAEALNTTLASCQFIHFAEIRRIVSGHMPALDGLRGIAILLVLLVHLSWAPMVLAGLPGEFLLTFTLSGWTGVWLFFVLSGFLITGILLDSKEADNYFSSFYMRRALRILPLSYAALLVGFILCPLLGELGVPFLPRKFSSAQLWYWLYAGNWAWLRGQMVGYFEHFWSLAVEEQFYLVWPWVVLMTSRRTLGKICIVLALVAPILRVLFHIQGLDPQGYSTTSSLDALCLGALAALIVRNENWVRLLIPRLNYFIYPGLVTFCLLGVANRSFSGYGWEFFIGALPLAVFFAGLLLRVVATTGSRSTLQRFLQARWLRSCGKYSYAMYVLHYPMVRFYVDVVLPWLMMHLRRTPLRDWFHHAGMLGRVILLPLVIIHILALCLFFFGIGKFSWWAFEGPINDMKKHFPPRWRSSIATPRDGV
jgi:peptidoglycan/LPS O-acetylase OafA/YrhL